MSNRLTFHKGKPPKICIQTSNCWFLILDGKRVKGTLIEQPIIVIDKNMFHIRLHGKWISSRFSPDLIQAKRYLVKAFNEEQATRTQP